MNKQQRNIAKKIINAFTDDGGNFFKEFSDSPSNNLKKILNEFEVQFPGIRIFSGIVYGFNYDSSLPGFSYKTAARKAAMYNGLLNCLKELDPLWIPLSLFYGAFIFNIFEWSQYGTVINSYADFIAPLNSNDQLLFKAYFAWLMAHDK